MSQLTENFKLKELIATNTGIDNTPPNHIVDNLYTLAQTLERVRTACGNNPIRVLSGYRSPDVNTAVKGSKTSAHMKGLAADFTVGSMTIKDVFCIKRFLRKLRQNRKSKKAGRSHILQIAATYNA